MTATNTETRPTRPCAHPDCGVPFVPMWHRSLYCDAHRTPEAAAERKKLRDELDAALERAAEATRAKTEPPTPHAPEPESVRTARDVERWVSSEELDEHELASAIANDELKVEDDGRGFVSARWILGYRTRHLGYRTRQLSRVRDVVERTKRVVGDAWTKDRPLDQAVQMKCNALERAAERSEQAPPDVACPRPSDHAEIDRHRVRADELQRERDAVLADLREARERLDDFARAEDRLQQAMTGLIEVELASRDDLDEDELAAEWDALDQEGVTRRASELAEYVGSLRSDLAKRSNREVAEVVSSIHREKRATLVEAVVEAITPPPGVSAAAVLRAVGYQIVTVDSPRGPVIVVEGARG
jgi:hypothetical protein